MVNLSVGKLLSHIFNGKTGRIVCAGNARRKAEMQKVLAAFKDFAEIIFKLVLINLACRGFGTVLHSLVKFLVGNGFA